MSQEDAVNALMIPDSLRSMGWKHAVMLRMVCKALTERGENSWRTLCDVLASEIGLYLPPSFYDGEGCWKKVFFDHLFPARQVLQISSLSLRCLALLVHHAFST